LPCAVFSLLLVSAGAQGQTSAPSEAPKAVDRKPASATPQKRATAAPAKPAPNAGNRTPADGLTSPAAHSAPADQPSVQERPATDPTARPERSRVGLPEDAFVFCSFNNVYKITPEVFDLWCQLLREVPDSVLWILSSHAEANCNLRREAERRGVAGARLRFAPRAGLTEHLARFRCADLFLDTYPCTAHTTASDALWCGVPVVTRMGETFASRVAASILHAIDLPQLVTHDAESYYALAHRLATARDELDVLKAHIERVRLSCALFDSAAYTRDLESLYAEALRRGPAMA
jgi:predicted O-linked N-acetylglucosamine transferase (SPINDLY family)